MNSEEEAWKQWARDYAKERYLKNKVRKQAYMREWNEKHKERNKERYEERKCEINARRRDNPKRKEYTKMYSSLKVKCSCGLELLKQNLPRHIKSKQHIEAPEKVKQILEDKTNPDITNRILSFLK